MNFCFRAEGFRGNAKGRGFRAYLEANNIPIREPHTVASKIPHKHWRDTTGSTPKACIWRGLSLLLPGAAVVLPKGGSGTS
jgi:hypothetical protein